MFIKENKRAQTILDQEQQEQKGLNTQTNKITK